MSLIEDEMRHFFPKIQFGVKLAGGSEAAAQLTKAELAYAATKHADVIALKVDFRNAFNAILRARRGHVAQHQVNGEAADSRPAGPTADPCSNVPHAKPMKSLDDPEVRALASRYGDPDYLLAEDWIPEVPGINAPGDIVGQYTHLGVTRGFVMNRARTP